MHIHDISDDICLFERFSWSISGENCETESAKSVTKSASEMIALVSQKPPPKKQETAETDGVGKEEADKAKQKLLPSCYYRKWKVVWEVIRDSIFVGITFVWFEVLTFKRSFLLPTGYILEDMTRFNDMLCFM